MRLPIGRQMTISRRRSCAFAAILVPLLLVFQASLSGAWMAAFAGERDAFGNILCTDHGPASAPPGHHGGALGDECCLFGCGGGTAMVPDRAHLSPLPVAFVLTSDRKRPVDAPV